MGQCVKFKGKLRTNDHYTIILQVPNIKHAMLIHEKVLSKIELKKGFHPIHIQQDEDSSMKHDKSIGQSTLQSRSSRKQYTSDNSVNDEIVPAKVCYIFITIKFTKLFSYI